MGYTIYRTTQEAGEQLKLSAKAFRSSNNPPSQTKVWTLVQVQI